MSQYLAKKKIFDLFFSFIGLIFLWPVILFGWIASSISTRSNGFFLQKRVGVNGKVFHVIKLKTMTDTKSDFSSITALNTKRITKVGALLRKTKIDELPQLINVFLGQMSFVGPRPDVEGYADKLTGNERKVLSFKPGITGKATIYFKYEEELLQSAENPQNFNDSIVYPLKTKINLEYAEHASIIKDVDIILQTVIGKSIYSETIIPFTSTHECIDKLESYKC
ncbi:sugar transferase [Photobacterium angustum]|uniref:Bacterial sugar transferase domain-containing protein n=1 Tax=Photobacterium angustum TaxID=661 RepID=A0A2S7VW08_PHOAN|nr:sugar transferase [Photobacterium angustum]PQJ66271.1 hypothetical protein BTO08_01975 [Photobacterium angustum]